MSEERKHLKAVLHKDSLFHTIMKLVDSLKAPNSALLKKIIVAAAITLILAVVAAAYVMKNSSNNRGAYRILLEADGFYQGKTYEMALESYKTVVSVYSGSKYERQALYMQGNCYYNMGKYDDALGVFTKVFERSSKDYKPSILLAMGYCHEQKGDCKSAIEKFKELSEKYPEYYQKDDALMELGKCFEKTGDVKSAKSAYQRIVDELSNSMLFEDARKKIDSLSAK